MSYIYNGRTIREGRSWKDDNGITHPSSWASKWSDADKAAIGVVYVPPSPQEANFDNRFYWGREVDGTLIPRILEDRLEFEEDGITPILDEKGEQVVTLGLKTTLKEKVNQQARGLLTPTDWQVIRGVENPGRPVNTGVATFRADVRTKSDSITALIDACTTLEEVIALHETPVDIDGNPTGNAPIVDWPEEV